MALDNSRLRLPPLEVMVSENERIDHRKRKRNRLRASCLNCYASKRKARDGKYYYFVCKAIHANPYASRRVFASMRLKIPLQPHRDEINRLRHRIAELESFVRELRNKPHPRWTAPGGILHDPDYVHFHPRPGQRVEDTQLRPVTDTDFHAAVREHGDGQNRSREHPGAKDSEAGLSYGAISWDSTVQALGTDDARSSAYSSTCDCDDHLSYAGSPDDARSSYNPAQPNRATPMDGFEYLLSPPVVERDKKSAVECGEGSCNCIKDQAAFAPLVNLSVALRTSREALEYLHPVGVDCLLYSRVIFLENHILSSLGSTGALGSSSTNTEVLHPPSHHAAMQPCPPRASTPVHHLPEHPNTQDRNRRPNPFAYIDNAMAYAPPRKWS
ncbi:hypothetical protein BU17DRAFT_70248 [Hysterangium stoloniferum]|nr:hypothetical protein BU17DRAFT_70248 [Hysterangium stoloniferum]